jgi:hypothetical protein
MIDEQIEPKPEIILTNITIRDNQDKNYGYGTYFVLLGVCKIENFILERTILKFINVFSDGSDLNLDLGINNLYFENI